MGTLFGAHPIVPCPVFRSPDIPLGYLGPENEDANYNEKNSNLMITTKKKNCQFDRAVDLALNQAAKPCKQILDAYV